MRELRGCGHMWAERYAESSAGGIEIEGDNSKISPPEGYVFVYGTARVCLRPFGHDGSRHSGSWSREWMTEKWRHAGPRIGFKRAVRPETRTRLLAPTGSPFAPSPDREAE